MRKTGCQPNSVSANTQIGFSVHDASKRGTLKQAADQQHHTDDACDDTYQLCGWLLLNVATAALLRRILLPSDGPGHHTFSAGVHTIQQGVLQQSACIDISIHQPKALEPDAL